MGGISWSSRVERKVSVAAPSNPVQVAAVTAYGRPVSI